MKKILIGDNKCGDVDQTTIVIPTNAGNWLQGLRDGHFEQCTVILDEPFEVQNNKFLLSIPRVMKADVKYGEMQGKIIINDRDLKEQTKTKVRQLMNDLELYELEKTADGYVMSKTENKKQDAAQQKLHIGFKGKIDEDELLKDDIVEKKPKVENCNVRPKACANCKCGRKQAEEKQNVEQLVKQINQGIVKSNCGNCYLGDAFRCASCPYKGLPAFKPGEKVELKLSEDVGSTAEQGKVQVKNGKVRLDLD